eukprot:11721285-Heterocapsa_arctica.AAC.1
MPPSVGVTVQGKSQDYLGVAKFLKGLRPPFFGKSYPSNDTPQLGLHVRLFGVALTNRVVGHLPVSIHGL